MNGQDERNKRVFDFLYFLLHIFYFVVVLLFIYSSWVYMSEVQRNRKVDGMGKGSVWGEFNAKEEQLRNVLMRIHVVQNRYNVPMRINFRQGIRLDEVPVGQEKLPSA